MSLLRLQIRSHLVNRSNSHQTLQIQTQVKRNLSLSSQNTFLKQSTLSLPKQEEISLISSGQSSWLRCFHTSELRSYKFDKDSLNDFASLLSPRTKTPFTQQYSRRYFSAEKVSENEKEPINEKETKTNTNPPIEIAAASPIEGEEQPQAKIPGRMAILFTCKKCETRTARSFSKQAYTEGVVLIRCPGCKGLHLIADNLGWFGEERNIEEILTNMGTPIKVISQDMLEYVVENVPSKQN